MNKEYKMIVFDMDGTLLNPKKQITPGVRKALEDAVNAGKHVVVATGRAINEVNEYRDIFPLLSLIVFAGGSVVFDPKKDEIIWSKQFEKKVADEIFEISYDWDIDKMYYVLSEGIGITELEQIDNMAYYHLAPYQKTFKNHIKQVPEIKNYYYKEELALEKINIFLPDAKKRPGLEQTLSHLPVAFASSEPTCMEITPEGISKIDGLRVVADHLGATFEQMITVGDASNDLTMLRVAGCGVAMGNGTDEAKEAADYVTADNEHDGCAEVIYKLLLKK